jgi:hypothetical protein
MIMKINNKILVLPILLLSSSLYADFMMERSDNINVPNEIKAQWAAGEHPQGNRPEDISNFYGMNAPDEIKAQWAAGERPQGNRPEGVGSNRPEGVVVVN